MRAELAVRVWLGTRRLGRCECVAGNSATWTWLPEPCLVWPHGLATRRSMRHFAPRQTASLH
eukprot:364405-Chlamydomonas_euryale.AAC.2